MKLSTKMRYGTRALVELAQGNIENPLPVSEMADKQDLSIKYLEQIMSSLRTAKLVVSVSGAHGGYMLAKNAKEIKLREIFDALEGPLSLVHCVDAPGSCPRQTNCPTIKLWGLMSDSLAGILDKTTLHDIAQ